MNQEIAGKWILQAAKLETGEELILPAETKDSGKLTTKELKKSLVSYSKLEPITASTISVFLTIRDKRYWVVIRKTPISCEVGFKISSDGSLTQVCIKDTGRKRRLQLMLQDGISKEDICETEELTLQELEDILKEV